MELTTVTLRLTGAAPMLMHSARLCDRTDPLVQAKKVITDKPARGKNAKTDEDHIEMQRLEFLAGLYHTPEMGVYIPGPNLEGVLRDGAKIARKGKATEAGLQIDDAALEFPGRGLSPEELWETQQYHDVRSVVVTRQRVMRTRPIFREWALTASVTIFSPGIKPADVLAWMEHAGVYVGLGDYRPKFGRFSVEMVG